MNTTSVTTSARQPGSAAAGTASAVASLFGGDAAATPFNDQLAQLNPLLRAAGGAAARHAAALPATTTTLDSNAGLAGAAPQPSADTLGDWVKGWLPTGAAMQSETSALRTGSRLGGRHPLRADATAAGDRLAMTRSRPVATTLPIVERQFAGAPGHLARVGGSAADQATSVQLEADAGLPSDAARATATTPPGLDRHSARGPALSSRGAPDSTGQAAVIADRQASAPVDRSMQPMQPMQPTHSTQSLQAVVRSQPSVGQPAERSRNDAGPVAIRAALPAGPPGSTQAEQETAAALSARVSDPERQPFMPDPALAGALAMPLVVATAGQVPAVQHAEPATARRAPAGEPIDTQRAITGRASTIAATQQTPAAPRSSAADSPPAAHSATTESAQPMPMQSHQAMPFIEPVEPLRPPPGKQVDAGFEPRLPIVVDAQPRQAAQVVDDAAGRGAAPSRSPTAVSASNRGEGIATGVPPALQARAAVPAPAARSAVAESAQALPSNEEPGVAKPVDRQHRERVERAQPALEAQPPMAVDAQPQPATPIASGEARPRAERNGATAAERASALAVTPPAGAASALPPTALPATAQAVWSGRPFGHAVAASNAARSRPEGHTDTPAIPRSQDAPEPGRSTAFAAALEQATLPPGIASHGAAAVPLVPTSDAPLRLRIDTAVDTPEFRTSLGVQVSVLARDGVQFAELNLNPAEMGPISVRIELDGQRAHVEFSVDSAATRAILESGLPELASALREAGLTLTGGGVSEHTRGHADAPPHRQPGDEPAQHGRHGQHRADSPDGAADTLREQPRPRRVQVAGGVDLYA